MTLAAVVCFLVTPNAGLDRVLVLVVLVAVGTLGVGVLAGNFHAGFWADKGSGLGAALAALGGGTLLLAISPLTVSHLTTVTVWAAV